MSRHLSSMTRAFTLSLLALAACDGNPIPTGPGEPASSSVAATAVTYTIRDLGIAGEFATTATSINVNGHVVGYWFRPDDVFRGFLWKNGVHTSIGTLGGNDSRAIDVNDFGHVVGFSQNANGRTRAFRWINGTMTSLGTLGGNVSRAFAINNSGSVVGESRTAANVVSHAFLLKNGKMIDLGTLGGANSGALDINEAGQVVGWSQTKNGTRHPFLWQNGVMKDLLAGSPGSGTAHAISAVGEVVGEKNNRAFYYSGGVLRILPVGTGTVATGIRGGRIVGRLPGVYLVGTGQITPLPLTPGASWNEARAINSSGIIVGSTGNDEITSVSVTMWIPQ
jgi:probable HAF family extracellular repeat protein